MSKTLSTSLYEAFERQGALKLRADVFLDVLRSVGAPMSPSEESTLIAWLGKDLEGCVDVAKFCARFERNRHEARFAQRAPASVAACVSESMIQENSEIVDQMSSTGSAASHGLHVKAGISAMSTEEMHDVPHLDDNNLEPLEATRDGESDSCDRPTFSFSRQVTADDNSVWSLGASHGLRVKARISEMSTEDMYDVPHLDDNNLEPLQAARDGESDSCDRPTLSFSLQVTADDNSVWSLRGEEHDKYTLPPRRLLRRQQRSVEKHLASAQEESSFSQTFEGVKEQP
eukprot:TRINITY_DN11435_c0_g2_i6.p1 TRINITY_DN11435_c0_g2~~TRINITY_DN11435_c0_g2_i6.p1  ORF type:complete len:287 (-),score=26.95 TRINITY_DN11435_c0_g2_i6:247-1107(-)